MREQKGVRGPGAGEGEGRRQKGEEEESPFKGNSVAVTSKPAPSTCGLCSELGFPDGTWRVEPDLGGRSKDGLHPACVVP